MVARGYKRCGDDGYGGVGPRGGGYVGQIRDGVEMTQMMRCIKNQLWRRLEWTREKK